MILTKNYRHFYRIALLFILLLGSTVFAQLTITNRDTASQAMIAAAHPRAVQAGIEMLKKGGNAVDAAVAAAFVVGVVEPYASGIGGGGGMLIYLQRQHEFTYLDYYMQASQNADTSFYESRDRNTPLAICIPGTPSGLITAVKKFGKLKLADVMAPALSLAREGIVVNDMFYEATLEKLDVILENEATKEIFLNDGLPYMVGDTIKNNGLYEVLLHLSREGEDYFYRGEFARKAASAIRQHGGILEEADFAGYHTIVKEPVFVNYRGFDIYSAPPPQSGTTLLEILKIFETIPQERWKQFESSAHAVHVMSEAIKRADIDRTAYIADPRFVEVPLAGLLDARYAHSRSADMDTAVIKYADNYDIPPGNPWHFNQEPETELPDNIPEEGPNTTHISVIDQEGNMVSLTQTLGFFYGCGFSVDGVLFNSSMSVFYSGSINGIEPGKRPVSTISPTIILRNRKPFAVLGTPGGRNIFNTMAQVIVRLIDFNQSPEEAVYAPRFSTRITSRQLTLEGRFPPGLIADLKERGYDTRLTNDYDVYLGGIQLILFDDAHGQYIGVSDPRRDGAALGY